MLKSRIVCNLKFVKRPTHTAPAMEIIREAITLFTGRITFDDVDSLIFENVAEFDPVDENARASFIAEVNRRAIGAFIVGSWKQKIEDLEDEPEEE